MIRTVLCTEPAVNAFCRINMRMMNNMNCFLRTVHHTRTGKTSLTGISYHIILFYTGIARFVKNRKHRPCRLIALKRFFRIVRNLLVLIVFFNGKTKSCKRPHFYKFAVVIDAAGKRLCIFWNDFLGNGIYFPVRKPSFQLQLRQTHKNLLFYCIRIVIYVEHIQISIITVLV